MQDCEALIKSGTSAEPNVDVELDDLASLNYTSGTTCVLKAAMLTHRNRICMAEKQSLIPGIVVGRKSILCHVEPLTHESYTITS
jgi:long-subunit acyl-CoA synthetase (AMP-forming)